MSRRTAKAIIVFDAKGMGAYSAYCPDTKSRSLLVGYDRCPKDTKMMGKWIEVTLDERNRVVEPVEIVPNMFETTVLPDSVNVRVKFVHDGQYNGRFEMYYNTFFGFICDPKEMVGRVVSEAWYTGWVAPYKTEGVKSKWSLSAHQESIEPMSNEPDQSLKVLTALVHMRRYNKTLLAWSTERPISTIVIDPSYCSNGNLFGRWVELLVDEGNRVHRPPKVLGDVFETRRNPKLEVLAEFQHAPNSPKSRHGETIFSSKYFRQIRNDTAVENVRYRGWYKGWIEYHQEKEMSRPRWRICMGQQVVELPDREERLVADCSSQNRSISPRQPLRNSARDHLPLRPDSRDSAVGSNHGPVFLQTGFRQSSQSPPRIENRQYKNLGRMPQLGGTSSVTLSQQVPFRGESSAPPPPQEDPELKQLQTKMSRVSDIFAFFNSSNQLQDLMRQMDIESYEEMLQLTELDE